MRQVTFHTGGHCMMARLLPGIELRLHDVAIHAGRRVRTKIGKAFRIMECKADHTQKHPKHDGDEQAPSRHTYSGILRGEPMGYKPA